MVWEPIPGPGGERVIGVFGDRGVVAEFVRFGPPRIVVTDAENQRIRSDPLLHLRIAAELFPGAAAILIGADMAGERHFHRRKVTISDTALEAGGGHLFETGQRGSEKNGPGSGGTSRISSRPGHEISLCGVPSFCGETSYSQLYHISILPQYFFVTGCRIVARCGTEKVLVTIWRNFL